MRRSAARELCRYLAISSLLAALLASVPVARASVTIGQLPPGVPSVCGSLNDWVQSSVSSGNPYVVPGTGTITSWSHISKSGAGQTMTMKIYRLVIGTTYTVVGHDGPRTLTSNAGLNSFPAAVPVKAGDVLGFNTGSGDPACLFAAPGDSGVLGRFGNAADGESPTFPNRFTDVRLNITAVFEPANTFTLGKIDRNKKKGTATVTATFPNAGQVEAVGKGVRSSAAGSKSAVSITGPGEVELKIRAKGRKRKRLNETGKVKLKPTITYTPTGGAATAQELKLKLRKTS